MKRIVICLLVFLFPLYAFCNDGYYVYGAGGTLRPEINKNIAMEKELIEIDVFPKTTWETIANYKCTFWFKNNTEREQTILIGFPIQKGYNVSSSYPYSTESNTIDNYNFNVIVEEKNIEWKAYDESHQSEVPGLPFLNTSIYAFEVTFQPGEIKKIINTYSEMHDTEGLGASKAGFTYILQSGNTWEKEIGCADIIVKYHAPTGNFISRYTDSNPYHVKTEFSQEDPYTIITYHAEKFKPETNISFPANLFEIGPFGKTNALFHYSVMPQDEKNGFYSSDRNIVSKKGIEFCDGNEIKSVLVGLSKESINSLKNSLLVALGFGGKTENQKKYFTDTYFSKKPACRYYISNDGSQVRPIFFEDFDFNKELPCIKKIYENFNSDKEWKADLTDDCIWMTNKIVNEDSWYYAALIYSYLYKYEEFNLPVSNKSVLRKLFYECGNFYYEKGFYDLASDIYYKAFNYSESYAEYAAIQYDHQNHKYTVDLTYDWINEGKDNAPCYYIYYNIVCTTCIDQMNKIKRNESPSSQLKDCLLTQLEFTLHMGYPHFSWLRKDPDIAFIRDNYPAEFEKLIRKYENR